MTKKNPLVLLFKSFIPMIGMKDPTTTQSDIPLDTAFHLAETARAIFSHENVAINSQRTNSNGAKKCSKCTVQKPYTWARVL